jgi:hypothetical protein
MQNESQVKTINKQTLIHEVKKSRQIPGLTFNQIFWKLFYWNIL